MIQSRLLPKLRIGNIELSLPIVQGAMGVRISRSGLAAAVSNEGCMGTIASVGLGDFESLPGADYTQVNGEALRDEIRNAKRLTRGPIAVNVIVGLSDYANLVRVAAEEQVDAIVVGGGLALDLPQLTAGSRCALIPIVSSPRALSLIDRRWWDRCGKHPDAVIVEGPEAGGHLGYSFEEVTTGTAPRLHDIVPAVKEVARAIDPAIPVIAAGGVFDGQDILSLLKAGADGVQMATRFVCTHECDASAAFKRAYVDSKPGDVVIVKSPLGLPGRVIRNAFVERILRGETKPTRCDYRCVRTCNPRTSPYCIIKVLANAAGGQLDDGFVFAGSNCHRCTEIISVHDLIGKLVDEVEHAAAAPR